MSEQVLRLPALSAFQRELFYDERNWLAIAGRRSGKSTAALLRGVKVARRGGRVSWASANKDTAEAGWTEVVEFCKPFASRVAASEDGILEFYDPKSGETGSIERRSAYSKSSGRGRTLKLVIIDEVQLTEESFFKRILPTILTTGGQVCLLGTPPETPRQIKECRWIKKMLDHPDRFAKDWLIVHKPTSYKDIAFYLEKNSGEKKTRAEFEKQAKASLDFMLYTMGPTDFDREFGAVWPDLAVGGQVYNFNLDKHCKEEFDYVDGAGPIFWVIDRGEGHALTIFLLCQWQGDRLVIFDELVEKSIVSEETMVNRALHLPYPLPFDVIYDPRAPGYALALSNAGLPFSPAAGRDIQRGIGKVRRWLSRGRILVNPRCLVLLENFENYEIGEDGLPIDTHNDAADDLRYLVRYLSEQEGEPWSEDEESRQIVEQKGGGLDYGAVIEVAF